MHTILGYERQRRHAALVATVLDLQGTLTDHAVDLFDRLIGMMFRKTEERHARAFQADALAEKNGYSLRFAPKHSIIRNRMR